MPPFSGRGRLKAANKWKFKTSNRTLDQDVWSISSAAMEVVVGGMLPERCIKRKGPLLICCYCQVTQQTGSDFFLPWDF